MARLPRVVLPAHSHHVTQRGVRSQAVFFSDDDRRLYLALMREQTQRHGVSILAYCLMTNHVHLLAVPSSSKGWRALSARRIGVIRRISIGAAGRAAICFRGAFSPARWTKRIC